MNGNATEGGVLIPLSDDVEPVEVWSPLVDPARSITAQVYQLATPVLIEQALLYLVGLSDTILAGWYLREEHLAAITVAAYLLWFLNSLMTVVSVGATALVARLTGARQPTQANRTTQQAITLALILGILVCLGGELVAPWLVQALNLEGNSAADATLFLRAVLVTVPLGAIMAAGIACLHGVGDTRTGMWVMFLVNAVNVGLAWPLVRGLGPIPALGFPGIVAGTAISEGVGGIAILFILARGRSGLRLSRAGAWPDLPESWRILRISLPASGESLTTIVCQLWFLGLINRLGATATAAHGVAIRCEALAFLTATAFSIAARTLVGQYLGAQRPDLATRAGNAAWGHGVVALTLIGGLLYLTAPAMLNLFLGGRQPAVVAAGAPVLRIVAFALPFLATMNILTGALQGAGDTRWPWLIVLVGYFGLRIPLTYALTDPSWFDLGLRGAWFAMFADLALRGLLMAARFLHGGWRRIEV